MSTPQLERNWNADLSLVWIKDLSTEEKLEINLRDYLSPTIFDALTLTQRKVFGHGWHQKVGDKWNTTKGDADEKMAEAITVNERIVLADEFTLQREAAGPRPTLVADAIMRALTEAGKAFDRDAMVTKYAGKDSKPARDKALSNDRVKFHYKAIQEEREAARLAKAPAVAPVALDDLAA